MCYNCVVQIKKGVKIMEIKEVLQKLNNQYFKSLKRFENVYKKINLYSKELKKFNEDYLKLIGAVLSGDTNEIRVILNSSLFFIYATPNEKEKIELELLGTFYH